MHVATGSIYSIGGCMHKVDKRVKVSHSAKGDGTKERMCGSDHLLFSAAQVRKE